MKTTLSLLFLMIFLADSALAAPTCCSTNIGAGAPLPDRSIYHLETSWTSDKGEKLKLAGLRGTVQLVTMFFSSCEYACPILVHDLTRIDAALKAGGVTNVGFTLVTFDTERDTVERLHAFRRQRQLDERWTLLRSEPEDVLEIAALLGIKFKKDARGQFAHSNVILVLDQEGQVVHQQVGLNQDPSETVSVIQKIVLKNDQTCSKLVSAP